MGMFDWFRPVVGNYSINVKCSNHLCNNSVIVPAQLNDNAVVYCDTCISQAKSRKVENCKHDNLTGNAPFIACKDCGKAMDGIPEVAKAVGKKEHKRLYRIANSMRDAGVYQPEAIYFGCWLVEYKWSWKLNKAVRL